MANINNYGELKSAISTYLDFADTSVTNKIPLFISMAESEIMSSLRIPSMERTIFVDITVDDLVRLPIPIDFLEMRRMYYPDTFETIDQIDLELAPQYKYNRSDISTSARPINFFRDQDYWYLTRPAINGDRIQITYYAEVTQMSLNSDTNILLRDAPNVLLYRALGEAHRFLENITMADYWIDKAMGEMVSVQTHSDRAENAGSIIVQANFNW